MAKINVGTRSKEQDAEALDTLITSETTVGKDVVTEGDAKFIVEKNSFGLTVKTRIA